MNEKLKELLLKHQHMLDEVNKLSQNKEADYDEINKHLDEIEEIEKEIETQERIIEAQKKAAQSYGTPLNVEGKKPADKQTTSAIKIAEVVKTIVRGQQLATNKLLSEGVGEDGKYTVPEDVETKINEFREAEFDMEKEISVVNVTTQSGSRLYRERASVIPFADVDEGEAISQDLGGPKYREIKFSIQKRAGFIPVTSEIIDDSDADIENEVCQFIAKGSADTSNKKVFGLVAKKEETDLKNIDGIKKAVNVTLGSAFNGLIKIYTNDDGLHYLDTLKDANGNPLLKANPTDPLKTTVAIGHGAIPLVVIPNVIKPTSEDGKIPFMIGAFKEYARKFKRKGLTIDGSTVASIGGINAFAEDKKLFRVIIRDDYVVLDDKAVVNGYIVQSGK